MKISKLVLLMLGSLILTPLGGCISGSPGFLRVRPGYVGIIVSGYGDSKGVQKVEAKTGDIRFNPLTEQAFEFPVFLQNYTWTKSTDEESPVDESISFNSKDGAAVNADVNVQYTFVAAQVDEIVQKYRTSADEIRNGAIRGAVRDAINREAGKYSLVEVYGSKKAQVLDAARASLNQRFAPNLSFEGVSFVGRLRVDPQIQEELNQTLKSSFDAKEAEAQLEVAKKNAQIAIEKAKEQRALGASITPALLQQQAITKWDGKLPQQLAPGAAVPFISIPQGQTK